MSITYHAKNLLELANYYESLANDCINRSKHRLLTMKQIKGLEGQAYAYRQAADIARKTIIVDDDNRDGIQIIR